MSEFTKKVYKAVQKVPRGKVATYGDIAQIARHERAVRAVGVAMKKNPNIEEIPCHRIVGASGEMHGYNQMGGEKTKRDLLKSEGVSFRGEKVDLSRSRWQPQKSS
jgi:O-6-methylguanine DNA methyltransferase